LKETFTEVADPKEVRLPLNVAPPVVIPVAAAVETDGLVGGWSKRAYHFH